jgi:nucleoside-diphosphate-sugar epimerase
MSDAGTRRKKVLITGAGGRVGTALRKHLRARYDLRLLDIKPIEGTEPGDEQVIADTSRFDDVLEATRGVDAIVHLALATQWRHATRASVARRTLEVDMPGLHAVYESARINKVGCVVFASTNHVTGLNEQDGIVSRPELPVRPDGIYGAGKAFGEALGRYYAERQGVRVVCLRIANFNGKDEPGQDYAPGESRWLSPRDAAQLVWRSIEAEHVPFGIFYAVSGGSEKKWDLTATREVLGYDPEDDGSLEKWRALYRG